MMSFSEIVLSPVSGSNSVIESISSPNISKRQALSLVVGREQVDRVAAHPEGAALEGIVVALVLLLDEAAQQRGAVDLLALVQAEGHRLVVLQRTDTVDAGDRGHDDHVVARSISARVAEWRMRSICSLIDESFSMKVSVRGT